jgi:outer membrane receptor protein involved in Fe transport
VAALGLSWQHESAKNMDFTRYFRFDQGFLDPAQSGSLLSDPNISNNDYAVFVQDVWDINPAFNLTVGGRYDRFDQFGGYFNYRAALVYTPTPRQTWKLLYGTAIRTPSFREYLKVLEGTDFVPRTPDPERLESLEIGFLQQWEQANLSVTLFHNHVDDTISEVPTPDGEDEYFANSKDPWRLRGVEALLQFRPMQDLDLRLSGSFLDAKVKGDGDLPYQASWSGSLAVNYAYLSKHRIGFSLLYNSSRSDTNDFEDDDPGSFVVANLFGSGRINKNLSYAFGIDNLFDAQVYDPAADFGSQYNTERSERELWLRLEWGFSP